jgi:hypothetical protein
MVGCKTRGFKRREINARNTKSRNHAPNLEPELSTFHFPLSTSVPVPAQAHPGNETRTLGNTAHAAR